MQRCFLKERDLSDDRPLAIASSEATVSVKAKSAFTSTISHKAVAPIGPISECLILDDLAQKQTLYLNDLTL